MYINKNNERKLVKKIYPPSLTFGLGAQNRLIVCTHNIFFG